MNDVFVKTDEYTKQFDQKARRKLNLSSLLPITMSSKQISDVPKDLISQKVDVDVHLSGGCGGDGYDDQRMPGCRNTGHDSEQTL